MIFPRKWLTLAGVFTWALVAYVDIAQPGEFALRMFSSLSFIGFLACFIPVASGFSERIAPRVTHKLFKHLLPLKSLLPHTKLLTLTRVLLYSQVCIAFVLLIFSKGSLNAVLLVVWAGQLPDFFSRRTALVLVFISSLGLYAVLLATGENTDPLLNTLIYFGFQLFALSSSFSRVSEQHARERAEQLNQQLLATRILLAQASTRAERKRIARDLHDILGHQLTALNLQLELLLHQVPTPYLSSVTQSKNLAQELLNTIRAVVQDQRTALPLDIGQAIGAGLVNMPQVNMQVSGALELESVQLAEQLVLCLQEGISNAVRHGRANQLELSLAQQGELITISLADNGCGLYPHDGGDPTNASSANINACQGAGLTGMSERLAAYQGHVQLLPQQQGCRLVISCRITQGQTL